MKAEPSLSNTSAVGYPPVVKDGFGAPSFTSYTSPFVDTI